MTKSYMIDIMIDIDIDIDIDIENIEDKNKDKVMSDQWIRDHSGTKGFRYGVYQSSIIIYHLSFVAEVGRLAG